MSHTAAHVGHASTDPDPRSCREVDRLRMLSRIDRNSAASAPLSTLVSAWPRSSMWIAPLDAAGSRLTIFCRSLRTSELATAITTGNSDATVLQLPQACHRDRPDATEILDESSHLQPGATRATLIPGAYVNSTIRRFSAIERRTRTLFDSITQASRPGSHQSSGQDNTLTSAREWVMYFSVQYRPTSAPDCT